jgi:hypothetical protein
MADDKPVTVRFPHSALRELMGLSVVDDTNLADQIRKAVLQYIQQRLSDPALQEQVAAARERQTSVLAALTER